MECSSVVFGADNNDVACKLFEVIKNFGQRKHFVWCQFLKDAALPWLDDHQPLVPLRCCAHPGTGEICANAIHEAIRIFGLHPEEFSFIQCSARDVGTMSILRFLRPVCDQNPPDVRLPVVT